jgi:hypothetical protein
MYHDSTYLLEISRGHNRSLSLVRADSMRFDHSRLSIGTMLFACLAPCCTLGTYRHTIQAIHFTGHYARVRAALRVFSLRPKAFLRIEFLSSHGTVLRGATDDLLGSLEALTQLQSSLVRPFFFQII